MTLGPSLKAIGVCKQLPHSLLGPDLQITDFSIKHSFHFCTNKPNYTEDVKNEY